jgi:transcriptional regulator with XRE-family HTH domain
MESAFIFETDCGGLIRKERKEQGLSMKALGNRVDLSEQAISQYERGKRRLKRGTASSIAEALGYSLIDLLDKYGHRYEFLSEWSGWDEDMWRGLMKSASHESKGIMSENDALIILFDKFGYYTETLKGGGYSIKISDYDKLEVNSAELDKIAEDVSEYINMRFTQLLYDHKNK